MAVPREARDAMQLACYHTAVASSKTLQRILGAGVAVSSARAEQLQALHAAGQQALTATQQGINQPAPLSITMVNFAAGQVRSSGTWPPKQGPAGTSEA